ncbi:MAG: hypothetical protein IPK29_19980 [Betaproteobacteria bacterium]|nr:hypothetical protein [Betaproteobacteria bacterium]
MPSSFAPVGSTVHPHQLEIQDFSLYALVIDARHPAAYAQDHIPGAVNVPAATAIPGTALPMPCELAAHAEGLVRNDMVLVYCDRGGLDSEVWARPLRAAGFAVDVLGGGWGNYRRWVAAGLELLPRAGRSATWSRRPSAACAESSACWPARPAGARHLGTGRQRLVPGLACQGMRRLRRMPWRRFCWIACASAIPDLSVWVRVGPAPLTALALPPALRDALARADEVVLQVPLAERAKAWLERIQAMRTPLPSLIAAFSASALPPPSGLAQQWGSARRSPVGPSKPSSGSSRRTSTPTTRWHGQGRSHGLISLGLARHRCSRCRDDGLVACVAGDATARKLEQPVERGPASRPRGDSAAPSLALTLEAAIDGLGLGLQGRGDHLAAVARLFVSKQRDVVGGDAGLVDEFAQDRPGQPCVQFHGQRAREHAHRGVAIAVEEPGCG